MLEWNQDQIIKCFIFPDTLLKKYFDILKYRGRNYQKIVISSFWLISRELLNVSNWNLYIWNQHKKTNLLLIENF